MAYKEPTIKEFYQLNPVVFKQPERLDFTPSIDMLISNEAAGPGSTNILSFREKQ